MKRNNRNKTRTLTSPIKVELSEAEIMADLHYPIAIERPVSTLPSGKRNPSR